MAIDEQMCRNCKWFLYKRFTDKVKVCCNDEQSHDYVKETDYCFRHELDENKKKQKRGEL